MNSSFDKLVKNLSDKDFKYFVEEFGSENLELLKQNGDYPYLYMNNCEKFIEEKCQKLFLQLYKRWKNLL